MCRIPTLNGRTALQSFECSNVIKMCNGIMFNSTQHCHHKIYRSCPIVNPQVVLTMTLIKKYGNEATQTLHLHAHLHKNQRRLDLKGSNLETGQRKYTYCVILFSTIIRCIIVKVRNNREMGPFHICAFFNIYTSVCRCVILCLCMHLCMHICVYITLN